MAQIFAKLSSQDSLEINTRIFCISGWNAKYEFFTVTWKKFQKINSFHLSDSRLKRKPDHWSERRLTSRRFCEVILVKFKQKLFFNFIFKKRLIENSKILKNFYAFVGSTLWLSPGSIWEFVMPRMSYLISHAYCMQHTPLIN